MANENHDPETGKFTSPPAPESEGQQEAPEQAPDWTPWQQHGFSPDMNPAEVAEAHRFYQGLSNRNYRYGMLTDTLQRGGELQEGEDWQTVQAALEAYRQSQETPEWAPDEQGMIDPSQIVSVAEQRAVQAAQAAFQQQMAAYQQQQIERDFGMALDDLTRRENLTGDDRNFLTPIAVQMMTQGRHPAQALGEAWGQLKAWRQKALGNAVEQQAQVQDTSGMRGGQTPSPDQGPAGSWLESIDRSARRAGMGGQ